MSVWSTEQTLNTPDVHVDRVHFGTLGGDHVIGGSVSGKKILSIIDDSDPRIAYGVVTNDPYAPGATAAGFQETASTDFQFGGTYTIIGNSVGGNYPGSAARLRFNGTSIAVIGGLNPSSGNLRVYIDGAETSGRVPITTQFRLGYNGYHGGSGILGVTDTQVNTLTPSPSFPASGTLYINGELITYTSLDGNGFYGCVRGVNGTSAVAHNANETIYLWASAIGLYTGNYASKQVLYYNPLLAPGDHTILIIAETNASSGNAWIYFDGFALGTLLGASAVFTQIASIVVNVTTSVNGYFLIGSIVAANNDVARLAYLGHTQSNTEADNTTILGAVGMSYVANQPVFYLHNGPPSATFNLTLTFAFIGETL